MRRLTITMLCSALLVAACGTDGADDSPPATERGSELPAGRDGVVLAISDEGGFVPVEFNLRRVPSYVVTSRGTLIYGSESNFDFPGPVIAELSETDLDDATLADVLQLVDDLDIASVESVEINNATNVADASTTVTRYFDDAGEHTLAIYALGMEGGGDARTAIVASLVNTLAEAATGGEPYVPDRIEMHVTSELGAFDRAITRPWPFAFSPEDLPMVFGSYRCVTLSGEDADLANSAFETADPATTWELDGTSYAIIARPLLPHMEGCG